MFIGTGATLPLTFDPPKPEKALTINEAERSINIRGRRLEPPLSLAQFRLLQLLFDADGAVCSRDEIVDVVWPGTEGIGVSEQAIDALVRRLRDRLAELDNHNFVVTVRGHGFKMDNPPTTLKGTSRLIEPGSNQSLDLSHAVDEFILSRILHLIL